ncbi:hypothetical protein OB920_10335 [Halobacteria archaeon HArc-gm2]|nr:hypothetical protein [Halobacteria archaeon HArc-gm2]
MKTCLSDDRPVWSLLVAGLYAALGTVYLWLAGDDAMFGLAWLRPLIVLAWYGLALYYLRYGVSHRPKRVVKLFEPRWLADDQE